MISGEKVLINLIWRFMERCGAQMVSFLVSIVLARILEPEEYGKIAIITVIITILNVFVDGGFGNALIQKKDADDLDFSTIFYFNIVICILIYSILFCSAPLISAFYEDGELVTLTRVLGLTVVVSGIKNIQQSYISKHFLFKAFFFATLIGTMISAVLGVAMAFLGYGVWALVLQHLSNLIIDTLILWKMMDWRPQRKFSLYRLKQLFSYGNKLLFSSLLNTIYGNFRQLIIGRIYSSAELAFYNRGKQFPSLMVDNVNNSIDSVLFPVMAAAQTDINEIRNMIKKSMVMSTFVIWPLLIGLSAISQSLVIITLTDKWSGTVPYLRIFCFTYATFPIQTANLNAIKAVGKSKIFLKLEIEQSLFGITFLIIAMQRGALWIAIMYFISAIVSCILIIHESSKIFNYNFIMQIKDIMPNFILTVIMGVVVFELETLTYSRYITIVIQICVGFIIYILGSKLFNFYGFKIVLKGIKNILGKL